MIEKFSNLHTQANITKTRKQNEPFNIIPANYNYSEEVILITINHKATETEQIHKIYTK